MVQTSRAAPKGLPREYGDSVPNPVPSCKPWIVKITILSGISWENSQFFLEDFFLDGTMRAGAGGVMCGRLSVKKEMSMP